MRLGLGLELTGVGAAASPPNSAEFQQFIDRLLALPVDARTLLLRAYIDGLVADDVWNDLDVIHVLAAYDFGTALTDLKSGTYFGNYYDTESKVPDFVQDRGYKGEGSATHLETTFNPSTAISPAYVRDDACFFGWSLTSTQSNHVFIGTDAIGNTQLWPLYSNGKTLWGANSIAEVESTLGLGDSSGFWLCQRTAANAQALYRNNTQVATSSTASAAPTNHNFMLPNGAYRAGIAGVGRSLNAAKRQALYDRSRTLLQALGALP